MGTMVVQALQGVALALMSHLVGDGTEEQLQSTFDLTFNNLHGQLEMFQGRAKQI
jgi:hypothetical protein